MISKVSIRNYKGGMFRSEVTLWVRNMYTGPGGGLYTGPDANPYMAMHPPWRQFAIELRKMRMVRQAELIENALRKIGSLV